MKSSRHLFAWVSMILLVLLSQAGPVRSAEADLEAIFRNPPAEAGIRCWWWWLNGNVTKEAITRDLVQMKAKGFSGACIFDAGGAEQRENAQVPEGPLFGSPAWRELFVHAVREADRLGLVLSVNIQSGWNLGGPDVTPEEATKSLVWTEAHFTGGNEVKVKLSEPKGRDGFYRDIAVLAVPVKAGAAPRARAAASSQRPEAPAGLALDGKADTFWVSIGRNPGQGPTPQKPEWIEIILEKPAKVSALRVLGGEGYSPKDCLVQVSTDGKDYRQVAKLSVADGKEAAAKFEPVEALRVRLVVNTAFDRVNPDRPRNVQVVELAVVDAEGKVISGAGIRRPIRDLIDKAAFHEMGGSAPDTRHLLEDFPPVAGEEDARVADVVNLTGKMAADGALAWQAPAGQWVAIRFGYAPTGARVSTSSGKWQGRVIDHMSRPFFEAYWNRNIEPMLKEIGPMAGRTLKYVQTDSWEGGGMNWTEGFDQEFRTRRGYDLMSWLPVVAGYILDGRDQSTRFLADFRKTISDCISDNHYASFAKLAAKHGMGLQPESAGPHAGPFDGLKNYRHSEIMMSEFWVPSPHRPRPEQRFFVKQAASAAHIYGKRVVGAESFTSIGPHWNDTPWSSQKPSFDHEICSGLNLVLVHTFTCSPPEMGLPGQEYFAGTHFNPQVTWWDMAGAFVAYLNRTQAMMQRGQFMADALYYYGDHVPNIARLKEDDPAKVLPGFDYDVTNEDMLLKLSVKDGRLVLPSGMSYRLLAMPDHGVLSLAAMRKVRGLVEEGAAIVGNPVRRTASLVEYPRSEEEVARLARELWGDAPAATGDRTVGRGRVLWGITGRQALEALSLEPDFDAKGAAPGAVDYIHHALPGIDWYFVCNTTDQPQSAACIFRIAGRQPELWDPLTGRIRDARAFIQRAERTLVPLDLPAYGSMFIVFRRPIGPAVESESASNALRYSLVATVDGPWQVAFDPRWGGPADVRFDKLVSWTERPEEGIRFYSGTATYRATLNLTQPPDGKTLYLELGDVRDVGIARVKVNGRDCGVTWVPPFRVDVTAAVKAGENAIEIAVANSWRNRLVGDRGKPQGERLTKTNIKIRPEWQLLESGLLGPVRVVAEE